MLSYFCHQAAQAPFHCTALRRATAEVYRRAANFLPVQLNCYHLAGKTACREQPSSLRHGFHQRTRQMKRERALTRLLGPPGATHSRPRSASLELLCARLSSFQSKIFEARKDHAVLFFVYYNFRAKMRVVKVYCMNSDYVSGQVTV